MANIANVDNYVNQVDLSASQPFERNLAMKRRTISVVVALAALAAGVLPAALGGLAPRADAPSEAAAPEPAAPAYPAGESVWVMLARTPR